MLANIRRVIVSTAVTGIMSPVLAQPTEVSTQPYAWRSVVIKANGFVNGVVFSPAEKGLFYINTDMGGAYRHDAQTGAWVCLTDWIGHDDWSLSQMGVETLAVDPADAERVYAGIGTYMGPSAIVRSVDRGQTWERTNVPFAMNGNGSARNTGQRMNVDPNLPSRLLYGTRTRGVWASDDYAVSWSQLSGFTATGDKDEPAKDAGVVWTLFDKSSGRAGAATPVAYAGVCTTGEAKIFRTRDSGKTWSLVPNQPGGKLLTQRAVLEPDGKRMYLTFGIGQRYPGPWGIVGGTVYRVDNPASDSPTWTEIAPAQGVFGFSGVSIDPVSAGTVYVTTLDRYGEAKDDIYRSTDAGATWSPLQINTSRDDTSAPYVKDFNVHWVGDIQVDPHDRNHAIFTTGYGLYRTTELTKERPAWQFYNEGFEQSAVLELISPRAGNANLLSAIGDRDGYRHEDLSESPALGRFGQPNDRGQRENLSFGTCHDIDAAWADPDIVVRVGEATQCSNDGGVTWRWFATEHTAEGAAHTDGQGPRDGSVAVSRDGGSAIWSPRHGTPLFARRSADGWSPWHAAVGLPQGDARIAADLGQDGIFYAASTAGFFVSSDGGAHWSRMGDVPQGGWWMRAIPGRQGHLWLTAGDEGRGGLYRTTDAGKTWARVLPDAITVAKQVGVGAPAAGLEYPAIFVGGTIGGLRGFFRSDDEGQTWVRINDDAHQYGNVTVINGDSRVHGRLYVGTNGRGIVYGDPR